MPSWAPPNISAQAQVPDLAAEKWIAEVWVAEEPRKNRLSFAGFTVPPASTGGPGTTRRRWRAGIAAAREGRGKENGLRQHVAEKRGEGEVGRQEQGPSRPWRKEGAG